MEKLFKKPIVICVMALICCALWGSAFPCVKIGYELLQNKNDRKPDFVCRIPIFRSRNTYVFDGMYY